MSKDYFDFLEDKVNSIGARVCKLEERLLGATSEGLATFKVLEPVIKTREGAPVGRRKRRIEVTPELIADIMRATAAQMRVVDICAKYDVSESTVYRVQEGQFSKRVKGA